MMQATKRRAHCLLHVEFEGLASIKPWLIDAGYEISYTRFYAHDTLPKNIDEIDLIIIMGGPMSILDEAQHTWLADEKIWLKNAMADNIPMLGICLGAQLIAHVLGASIYANRHKEIGWFDVQASPAQANAYCFPKSFTPLHWHGETFDLPQGATLLAQSKACKNQAFQFKNIIGLQFHLEMNAQSIADIIKHCAHELSEDAAYIQTAEAISNQCKAKSTLPVLNNLLHYMDQQITLNHA